MAIAFRNAEAISSESHSVTITKPTDTAENDILVAVIIAQTDAGASPTITAPAGWTAIDTYKIETLRTWGLYWKRAGGAEGANYTWTQPNVGAEYTSGAIASYSGCITSGTPYDQYSNTDYVTSDLYMRGGSITPRYRPAWPCGWGRRGRASTRVLPLPGGPSGWITVRPISFT